MKTITFFARVMAILILLMLVINTTALASAQLQEDAQPNLISKALLWLVTGGSVVAVSWLSERSKWFQSLEPQTKQYIQYGASAGLGVVALLVQNYVPTPILELISPYFAVITGVFGMIFLNQAAHVNNPARKQ